MHVTTGVVHTYMHIQVSVHAYKCTNSYSYFLVLSLYSVILVLCYLYIV